MSVSVSASEGVAALRTDGGAHCILQGVSAGEIKAQIADSYTLDKILIDTRS